jgi:hypothetical protein
VSEITPRTTQHHIAQARVQHTTLYKRSFTYFCMHLQGTRPTHNEVLIAFTGGVNTSVPSNYFFNVVKIQNSCCKVRQPISTTSRSGTEQKIRVKNFVSTM